MPAASKTPAALTELGSALGLAIFVMGALAMGYRHQGYSSGTSSGEPISWLMFFTLGAGLIIAVVAFSYFLRSRRNRAIAQDAVSER
jgi:hypothetical protein